jgi:hypothetical protein
LNGFTSGLNEPAEKPPEIEFALPNAKLTTNIQCITNTTGAISLSGTSF